MGFGTKIIKKLTREHLVKAIVCTRHTRVSRNASSVDKVTSSVGSGILHLHRHCDEDNDQGSSHEGSYHFH